MCRYLIVLHDSVNDKHEVIGAQHDYNKACDEAEEFVTRNSDSVEIFERVSTARPTTSVAWEGRRRPGVGANGA
jgi:hypothetical protein